MKNIILLSVIFSTSLTLQAGTIYCEIKDLASADVFSSHLIKDIQYNDLKTGVNFVLANDFSQTSFEITTDQNQKMFFHLSSISDVEESAQTFVLDEAQFSKKFKMGSVSVMSQALNQDTLYSYCEWNP